jgi:hypothetical protein
VQVLWCRPGYRYGVVESGAVVGAVVQSWDVVGTVAGTVVGTVVGAVVVTTLTNHCHH